MNFPLCSMILICSVRIVELDRFTAFDVFLMHYHKRGGGHALITYTNDTELCREAWNFRYYPEIPYVYLYCDPYFKIVKTQPKLNFCPGFDCWESQMSLVTRTDIIDIMNLYREKVARGQCRYWCANNTHRLIFELRWNYYLERNSSAFLEECPRSSYQQKKFLYVGKEAATSVPAYKESVSTSFKMETGLQSELRSILWRLMYLNVLFDWDKESQFRRGDMHDMACTFICRRNVSYVTGMNETVIDGIVGHFACVFISLLVIMKKEPQVVGGLIYIFEYDFPINTTLTPSKQNCIQADENAWLFGGEDNFFPTLCRRNLDPQLPVAVLFDSCGFTPQSEPDLCPGSQYSPITWEEKFYGLILRFVQTYPNQTTLVDIKGQCNVPPPTYSKPHSQGPNILNYACTLKEVVGTRVNITRCSGWNCADSQLTDATRVKILEGLNRERHRIAKGQCSDECPHPCKRCNINARYCNMVNVEWHWFLERKAAIRVSSCPKNVSFRRAFSYDDEPFSIMHQPVFEEITLVFDLPHYEGQLALPKTFVKLFWRNAFKDWTDYHYFRRGTAQFIGCAIVTRPNTSEKIEIQPEMNFYNGVPTHMVCIYASLNGSFRSMLQDSHIYCCPECNTISLVNPCWMGFTKNISPVEDLCYSTQLPLTMNCQVGNRCDDGSISRAWHIQHQGYTLVQTLNGSLIQINRSSIDPLASLYEIRYRNCSYATFIYVLQLPFLIILLCMIYSQRDINTKQLLEKSLPEFVSNEETLAASEAESSPSEDLQDDRSARAKTPAEQPFSPKIRTIKQTRKPTTAPVYKTTPVTTAPPEDDDIDEEKEYEDYGGPTRKLTAEQATPAQTFTRRPRKERKPPKRAKDKKSGRRR